MTCVVRLAAGARRGTAGGAAAAASVVRAACAGWGECAHVLEEEGDEHRAHELERTVAAHVGEVPRELGGEVTDGPHEQHEPDGQRLPPVEADETIKFMRDYTSIWCCSQPLAPRAPGHIWYDMFWDVVPHTNRHSKLVDKPWVPTFGP